MEQRPASSRTLAIPELVDNVVSVTDDVATICSYVGVSIAFRDSASRRMYTPGFMSRIRCAIFKYSLERNLGPLKNILTALMLLPATLEPYEDKQMFRLDRFERHWDRAIVINRPITPIGRKDLYSMPHSLLVRILRLLPNVLPLQTVLTSQPSLELTSLLLLFQAQSHYPYDFAYGRPPSAEIRVLDAQNQSLLLFFRNTHRIHSHKHLTGFPSEPFLWQYQICMRELKLGRSIRHIDYQGILSHTKLSKHEVEFLATAAPKEGRVALLEKHTAVELNCIAQNAGGCSSCLATLRWFNREAFTPYVAGVKMPLAAPQEATGCPQDMQITSEDGIVFNELQITDFVHWNTIHRGEWPDKIKRNRTPLLLTKPSPAWK